MTATPITVAAPGTVRLGSTAGRWVLITAELGSGLILFNGTVINVAAMHFGARLHAGMAEMQWAVGAYMLTLASFVLLGGSLGDRYGRRRVFCLGLGVFGSASVLCGLSPDIGTLIAARALQGCGGALVVACSLALLRVLLRQEDQAKAIGIWSALGGVVSAVGPFLGGWLVAEWGWRWALASSAVVAGLAVWAALTRLPESRAAVLPRRFDLASAALTVVGLGGLSGALISVPQLGIGAWPVVASGGSGALALVVFVRRQRRLPEPLVPLHLFRSRGFAAANIVLLCLYSVLAAVLLLVAIHLQLVVGFSPTAAGLSLLPFALLMMSLSQAASALCTKLGPRLPIGGGMLLAAVGAVLLSGVGPGASYASDILPGLVALGTGVAATFAPVVTVAVTQVDVRHGGLASGVCNMVSRTSNLLGVAGIPAVAGLSRVDDLDAATFGQAFPRMMAVCCGILLLGALVTFALFPSGREE